MPCRAGTKRLWCAGHHETCRSVLHARRRDLQLRLCILQIANRTSCATQSDFLDKCGTLHSAPIPESLTESKGLISPLFTSGSEVVHSTGEAVFCRALW